jgi:hypothetical protein
MIEEQLRPRSYCSRIWKNVGHCSRTLTFLLSMCHCCCCCFCALSQSLSASLCFCLSLSLSLPLCRSVSSYHLRFRIYLVPFSYMFFAWYFLPLELYAHGQPNVEFNQWMACHCLIINALISEAWRQRFESQHGVCGHFTSLHFTCMIVGLFAVWLPCFVLVVTSFLLFHHPIM